MDLIDHENLIQLACEFLHFDRKLEILSEDVLRVHVLGLLPQIAHQVPVEQLNALSVHLLVEDPEQGVVHAVLDHDGDEVFDRAEPAADPPQFGEEAA